MMIKNVKIMIKCDLFQVMPMDLKFKWWEGDCEAGRSKDHGENNFKFRRKFKHHLKEIN